MTRIGADTTHLYETVAVLRQGSSNIESALRLAIQSMEGLQGSRWSGQHRQQAEAIWARIQGQFVPAIDALNELAARAERLLRDALPETLCRPLSEDAVRTRAIGDVLWIRYQENREPVSDEGFLMVFGAERFWLFQPVQGDNGEAKIRLLPGTVDTLQQGIRQIVSKYV